MTHRKDLWAQEPEPDIEGLRSPDPARRALAVRSLCPCRGDWNTYGEHLGELQDLMKDPDPVVRLNALHVAKDAFVVEIREEKLVRAAEAGERNAHEALERDRRAQRRTRARRR